MSSDIHIDFGVTLDETAAIAKALREMTDTSVMAGFPADEKPREDKDGEPEEITNAAIAYVQNTGMPELNIPQREFMVSGIESVEDKIVAGMEATGLAAFDKDGQGVDQGFHAVGQTAKQGIQMKIVEGPFVPLSDETLKARARNSGSAVAAAAQKELDSRAAGNAPDVELARPLQNTGQLRNAVNYVLRKE